MKIKKIFKWSKLLLILSISMPSAILLNNTQTFATDGITYNFNDQGKPIYMCISNDEAKKNIDSYWQKINSVENFKQFAAAHKNEQPNVLFLEAGGGHALPDPIKLKSYNYFDGCLGNKNGKMNDSAILLNTLTAQKINNYKNTGSMFPEENKNKLQLENQPNIYPMVAVKPDNSIKIPDEIKNNLTYIHPEIEPVKATGTNANKNDLENKIYEKYPGATTFHTATLHAKEKLSKATEDEKLSQPNFMRISFQTADSYGTKFKGARIMINKNDNRALEFAQKFWLPLEKNIYPEDELMVSENSNNALAKQCIIVDDERYGRMVPKTSNENIATVLYWLDHTDNLETQFRDLDEDTINRHSTMLALAILRYFKFNPRVANITLTPAEIDGEQGVVVKIYLDGENLNEIEEGTIVVSRADIPSKEFKFVGKLVEETGKKHRLCDANRNNPALKLDENLNAKKEENNEYYIKIYVKNSDKSCEQVPCNVSSFKIKPKEIKYIDQGIVAQKKFDNKIVAETNTVQQKTLQDKLKKQL